MHRSSRKTPGLLLLAIVLVGLFACGGASQRSSPEPASGPASLSPPPPASGMPQFSHVVLVVEENHSYEQVIGNPAMPFLNRLAEENALATQYFANAHPSIPDYFMMTTGQMITTDNSYSGTVTADNMVRQLVAAGKSWKSYAESLPSVGYTGDSAYPYMRRHNPFAYFSDVVGTPQANNQVPFTQFSGDLAGNKLPDFVYALPNMLHDAHDCPDGTDHCSADMKLAAADAWLQQNIAPLLNDPNFQGSGLLIVVFDEGQLSDSQGGGGHIAMVMAGTGVKKAYRSSTRYDHAALLRAILQALGVQHFPGAAANAPEMSEFF